jgi:hypothetical protein
VSIEEHEVVDTALRGFGAGRVSCSCGSTFLSTWDWQTHVEQAEGNISVDGPGLTVPRACDHLAAVLDSRRRLTVTECLSLAALAASLKGRGL